jgi:hypothetical protein
MGSAKPRIAPQTGYPANRFAALNAIAEDGPARAFFADVVLVRPRIGRSSIREVGIDLRLIAIAHKFAGVDSRTQALNCSTATPVCPHRNSIQVIVGFRCYVPVCQSCVLSAANGGLETS